MIFGIGRTTPNRIDTIAIPGYVGAMGLVACPGVRVAASSSGNRKNFACDLKEIEDWGANGVVCLLEPHELIMHKIEDLPTRVTASGMWWRQLPIIDMNIPSQEFEDNWAEEGELIRHALRIGERVVFHCYAGLGPHWHDSSAYSLQKWVWIPSRRSKRSGLTTKDVFKLVPKRPL